MRYRVSIERELSREQGPAYIAIKSGKKAHAMKDEALRIYVQMTCVEGPSFLLLDMPPFLEKAMQLEDLVVLTGMQNGLDEFQGRRS